MDKIDLLAAVFSLLKFIVMRLSAELPDSSRSVDAYFSGTVLCIDDGSSGRYVHSTGLFAKQMPYALNKLTCIRELFLAYELARQCGERIDGMLTTSHTDALQLQLLASNVRHVLEKCHYLCGTLRDVLCGGLPLRAN